MAKGGAPDVPDYSGLARQDFQQGLNTSQFNAGLNRINQFGPTGQVTYNKTSSLDQAGYDNAMKAFQLEHGHDKTPPAGPNQSDFMRDTWDQTTSLSPEQQALYNSNTANQQGMSGLAGSTLGRVGDSLNSALPNSNVAVNSVNGGQGYETSRDAVVQALMSRAMPQVQNDRHDLESSLLNSGIEKGTEAWNRAQTQQGQKENDLQMQALLAGGQEQSRLAGLDLGAAQFANSASGQNFGQGLAARQVPINEYNALNQGAGTVSSPQLPAYYTTGGGSAGGSQMEAAQGTYNAQSQANNAKNTSTNATYGAVLSALAMAFSDERLKDNIQTIGMHPVGVRRVRWDWKDGTGSDWGVIAQELQEVKPEAVKMDVSGFLRVNYDLIGGR